MQAKGRARWARAVAIAIVAVFLVACGQGLSSGIESAAPTALESADTSAPASAHAPSPTLDSTPAPSPSAGTGTTALEWVEAGRFSEEGPIQLVAEVGTWKGGFIAIGHVWHGGFVSSDGAPRIWLSPDGRSWESITPDLGDPRIELRGILPLASGGVLLVGHLPTVGVDAEARAWRSSDGRSWTPADLPSELVGPHVDVASGPMGHVISSGRQLWHSADGESWQPVHEAPEGVEWRSLVAGDEGFVATAYRTTAAGDPIIFASGDGMTWYAGAPPAWMLGVAAWRGDWLGWAFTDDPTTISVLHSQNGLEWSLALDVNELTPPDGPKAGQGMESGITEATLSSADGIAALTLGWNHCCAQPPMDVEVFLSLDGDTWEAADLPAATHVTSVASNGEVVVLGGHYERGLGVVFWVAER